MEVGSRTVAWAMILMAEAIIKEEKERLEDLEAYLEQLEIVKYPFAYALRAKQR